MKTGRLVTGGGEDQPHLVKGSQWLEVFPEGTVLDWKLMRLVPPHDRTYSYTPTHHGQSPVLVRLTTGLVNHLAKVEPALNSLFR